MLTRDQAQALFAEARRPTEVVRRASTPSAEALLQGAKERVYATLSADLDAPFHVIGLHVSSMLRQVRAAKAAAATTASYALDAQADDVSAKNALSTVRTTLQDLAGQSGLAAQAAQVARLALQVQQAAASQPLPRRAGRAESVARAIAASESVTRTLRALRTSLVRFSSVEQEFASERLVVEAAQYQAGVGAAQQADGVTDVLRAVATLVLLEGRASPISLSAAKFVGAVDEGSLAPKSITAAGSFKVGDAVSSSLGTTSVKRIMPNGELVLVASIEVDEEVVSIRPKGYASLLALLASNSGLRAAIDLALGADLVGSVSTFVRARTAHAAYSSALSAANTALAALESAFAAYSYTRVREVSSLLDALRADGQSAVVDLLRTCQIEALARLSVSDLGAYAAADALLTNFLEGQDSPPESRVAGRSVDQDYSERG